MRAKGYRIPRERLGCRFDFTWQENQAPFGSGEHWMETLWECKWFEDSIESGDPHKAEKLEALIDFKDFKCSPECIAYEPEETIICPKHDIEYRKGEWCDMCHPDMEEYG